MRVSEPSYSIKNIERFYLDERMGEVKDAGASIVYYEKWKDTGEPGLLEKIEDYNREDVRSTCELNKWLLKLRPKDLPWFNQENEKEMEKPDLTDAEKRLIPYRESLVDSLPEDRSLWGPDEHHRELCYQLLDFHRRTEKPQWWAMFDRRDMTIEERLEDPECIAGLRLDPKHPPKQEKRSIRYAYTYPEQETKLKIGDPCVHIDTTKTLNELTVDEEERRVSFKLGVKQIPPPSRLDIGLGGPIPNKPIINAVFRYADGLIGQLERKESRYPAIDRFLRREIPAISHISHGQPIIDEKASDQERQIIRAVTGLEESYLFIQGPPGAGKTYTGSRVIVELLQKGKKVGVSSNSHKAINNLLNAIERDAIKSGLKFRGVKKSSEDNISTHLDGKMIVDVFDNKVVFGGKYQLIAGTAWLFSDTQMDQTLDYIFIDEAGQIALANLVALGTSARNIVLLGDQMQLGQPVQGVHPGLSGESSLDYLLEGQATIPPDRGIFLKTSWRLHPAVCSFISDAVYDGRLQPETQNSKRKLVLNSTAHSALMPAGIRYIPANHDGCSQFSREEADLIKSIYENLLSQSYTDAEEQLHSITAENILIVAPYNMQVALLKRVLPTNARVGTVDKFQGQEAEIVLVSMATSSGEDLPINIEFLYSKNRLNVAVSRAKCLAIVAANPALMSIHCKTPEQMALVNTLCWLSMIYC